MRRILHFGPGNFFRAHLAEYAFDAGGWDIVCVSLRSATLRDGLARQGNVYTLAVQGEDARRIDVISDVRVAPEDPDAVLDLIADPQVEVISATVTEKGYHLGRDGKLDLDDPDIAAEIAGGTPRTLIGFLAHGLSRRTAPVTILSCDNRNENGDTLGAAVRRFAQAAGLDFACKVSFPNAMVDRITPATTDALREQTGDDFAVPCEPFKEWVIEDTFATPRPDWPGVQWVDDVAPHEMRKLRMLNGAHSYMAYAGTLAGHTYIHEAIADPDLRPVTIALMQEAGETLPGDQRDRAPAYAEALLERWKNPHINHKLRQIAMDGTQKMPYRMVETLRDRKGAPSPGSIAGIRAWIDFCRAETAAGRKIDDPKADALAKCRTDADFMALLGAEDLVPLIAE